MSTQLLSHEWAQEWKAFSCSQRFLVLIFAHCSRLANFAVKIQHITNWECPFLNCEVDLAPLFIIWCCYCVPQIGYKHRSAMIQSSIPSSINPLFLKNQSFNLRPPLRNWQIKDMVFCLKGLVLWIPSSPQNEWINNRTKSINVCLVVYYTPSAM